jgi:rRNA maturation RNase YbeY
MIQFFYEDCETNRFINERELQKTSQVVDSEGFNKGGVSVVFCSDPYLLQINKQHLNHDFYTDIITFSYVEGDMISGDLFISIDRVSENAEQEGVSKENELARVLIHGLLHLCGYNDKEEEEINLMRSKEKEYLLMIGFT